MFPKTRKFHFCHGLSFCPYCFKDYLQHFAMALLQGDSQTHSFLKILLFPRASWIFSLVSMLGKEVQQKHVCCHQIRDFESNKIKNIKNTHTNIQQHRHMEIPSTKNKKHIIFQQITKIQPKKQIQNLEMGYTPLKLT